MSTYDIGGYRFVRPLGRGGMGAVFEVTKPGDPRRFAAKVLLRSEDPVARERFRREGQLVARLNHPGIVRVHDALETGDRLALVFELVDGRPLSDVLERSPLSEAEVVSLGVAVARALGHAHAQGVVHRDVKPANVMIDRTGAPRLADFGVALASDLERLTRTGHVAGTPAYMAPEQLGAGGPIGPACDVYALGVVLFEALTGALPFESVFASTPTPIAALRPGVSLALTRVLERCLRRDPRARYADGDALADALEEARSPDRKRRLPLVAGLVPVVLAAGAWAVWSGTAAPPAPAAPIAPPPPARSPSADPKPADAPAPPVDTPAWSLGLSEDERFRVVLSFERRPRLMIVYEMEWVGVQRDGDVLHVNLAVQGLKVGITRGARAVPIDTSIALRFTVDRRTGHVAWLRGADRLQAFFLRGRPPAADDVYATFIRGVVNDDFLRRTLEKLLHVLPSTAAPASASPADRAWSLRLDAEPGGERRCTLEGDPHDEATVRHALVPPPERAGWVLEGTTRFRDGRLVDSVVTERSGLMVGGDDEFVLRRLPDEAPR